MTAQPSRCRTCKAPAVIDLPRHNANCLALRTIDLRDDEAAVLFANTLRWEIDYGRAHRRSPWQRR